MLITATTSIHLPEPVSTDLTIKPDSAEPNQQEKMGHKAGHCKTSTLQGIFIVTPSLEGW